MGRWDGMKGPKPVRIGRFGSHRKSGAKRRMDSAGRKYAGRPEANGFFSGMTAVEKGRMGEEMALEYLLQRGYRLVERNRYCGSKELDLIVEGDDGLHFVEVRTRGKRAMVPPLQTVDARKRERILKAAGIFVREKACRADIHFDIFAVSYDETTGKPESMDFIKDAFTYYF